MTSIRTVRAREILDARGWPTVEVDVELESGARGRASVPAGVTISPNEAFELRDGDSGRYCGRGVLRAVEAVNTEVARALVGHPAEDQPSLDALLITLDGTPTKERLGANSLLPVSSAAARAAAAHQQMPLFRYLGGPGARTLPVPLMNLLIGGVHAANDIAFQEIMIAPVGAESFADALHVSCRVWAALRERLQRDGHRVMIGDEGGFAPSVSTTQALQYLVRAIEVAGYEPGRQVALCIDVAAAEFHDGRSYFCSTGRRIRSAAEQVELMVELVGEYPIISLEDPMAPDDLAGWSALTSVLGATCQLVGDDLFCTDADRVAAGIEVGIANAVLIKPTQIGTLTETIAAARTAMEAGYAAIVSHRSGETEDPLIADLAVALGGGQLKAGAPSRSERTAKYNQLLRIEESLGSSALYGRIG